MPITRNTDQRSQILQEFYQEIGKHNDYVSLLISNRMLELLDMIDETCKRTQLWGVTSPACLIIQSENDWKSPRYIVKSIDNQYFVG